MMGFKVEKDIDMFAGWLALANNDGI